MKKGRLLFLVLVFVVLLSACSVGVPQSEYDALQSQLDELQDTIASMEAEKTANSGSETAAAETDPKPSTEATVAPVNEIGARKNPVPIGQVLSGSLTYFGDPLCEFEMSITNVVRGDEAWAAIKEANMFNDAPPEGYEYVLIQVWTKNVTDLSGSDEPLAISRFDFELARGDDSISSDQPSIVVPSPELDFTLYEGSEDHGYIAFLVKQDDANIKVVFTGDFWFLLQ